MTARQVILLRHGLTDWNDAGRFQGQVDVPLNAVGLAQAESAAESLSELGITQIVSSDLIRAVVTARIVAARCGLPVVFDARLQEVNVGSWAGKTMSQIAESEPDFRLALAQGRDFSRSATGETGTQAGRRMAEALVDYALAGDREDVLLAVGHGLASRVAALLLIGLDYSHARCFAGIGNCQWVILEPAAEHWRLVGYNRSG